MSTQVSVPKLPCFGPGAILDGNNPVGEEVDLDSCAMSILDSGSLQKVIYFECPAQSVIRPFVVPEDTVCIELVTDGVAYFKENGVRRKCTVGTIVWNMPGDETIHETEVKSPYRCYAFHFKGCHCGHEIPRISLWTPAENALVFGVECLASFHSNAVNRAFLGNYIYASLLYHATKPQASKITYPPPLNRAMTYIDKHLDEGIGPDDIAAACGISKPYVFALFKKHLLTTPHQYILNARMTKAKSLLCTGNTPIKEIAGQCCFNNLEVFYRQFRKNSGFSPAQYRHKYSQ